MESSEFRGIDIFSISTFSGGISNYGTISAVAKTGIVIGASNPVSSFLGDIFNSGTIKARTGIILEAGTVSGSIVDSGTIMATSHGIVISSGGEIVASGTPFAITITGKTFTGGIANSGLISGGINITSAVGVSIFDAGSILASGGTAIEFAGSGNTLTLAAGYDISGLVDPQSGTNTLVLGGSGAATFDLSDVGSGKQYVGFTNFQISGGTWTLNGSGGGWIVDSGATVKVASGADLLGSFVHAGATLVVEFRRNNQRRDHIDRRRDRASERRNRKLYARPGGHRGYRLRLRLFEQRICRRPGERSVRRHV